MLKKFLKVTGTFILLFVATNLYAQDLFRGEDLSKLKVDQLTETDISKFKTQLTNMGMTLDQAEKIAVSKGMPLGEFDKLRQRIAASTNRSSGPNNPDRNSNGSDSTAKPQYQSERPRSLIDSLIFGSELYTSVAPSFEPNLNMATPLNYILGSTDVVSISIYGVQQYEGEHRISAEGSIQIPNVGQIKLAGLSFEEATEKLKTVLGNSAYPYLKSGGSKLALSLAKIRTIRVNVIGANFPGNFNVSSLTTVFNVLYLAGGPSKFGSFREIELMRNGKLITKIDLYRFLLNGDQSDNIGLKDNDVIRIPPYKKRVELRGQVKRPGIFELLPGENFSNVIEFASGFTDSAYTASVKVYQQTDRERKVTDITSEQYTTYTPKSGDLFIVSKILNRFANRVRISGAVFRPDVYALTPGMTVADLIRKADGIREDAYTGRAQVMRLQDNLQPSILSFDIKKALSNDPEHNFVLKREDEVLIVSVQDLQDKFKITIQGEVRLPGEYNYVANLTLKDLILKAGGFTDAAYKNIEISRLLKRDSISSNDFRSAQLITTQIEADDLQSAAANVKLEPYDVVTIRRKAGYQLPESITVIGQVQFPGPYTLNRISERVSDIYNRAGGALPDADLTGAYIKRFRTQMEIEALNNKTMKIQKDVKADTSNSTTVVKDFDQIPLDLPYILSHPGSIEDIFMKEKDQLVIPRYDAQVKVSGAVLLPTQITYRAGNKLEDYIDAAGGYAYNSMKRKSFVIYPNGKTAVTKHFLFFSFSPKVTAGAEIVVPYKPEKRPLSTTEIIGLSSVLASLAGVVLALLRL
ncbi:sugar transporter [Sediminibacterium roseum]|uniref:Sugar transporter n=1 Tax=Sediminibacterium roseum TaxID=1978412 RepID=A0ABW9ZTI3_9BACT|nr:SLBB domain-containing protein [Sediminibacterium roseum]NCI49062.1 sugar transporter [Sediminibacterium roseum]